MNGSSCHTNETADVPALPMLFDPEYERDLEQWARGWDAAVAFYKPRLDNLEAENDRLYLRAYNSPTEVKKIITRRLEAGLAEYAEAFFRGESS